MSTGLSILTIKLSNLPLDGREYGLTIGSLAHCYYRDNEILLAIPHNPKNLTNMKIQKSKLTKLAYSGVTGLAMAQAVSAATILSGGGAIANNTLVDGTGHGSNASGTPNVSLVWFADTQWDFWTSRTTTTNTPFDAWPSDPLANGVYQMDNADAGVSFTIAFTPDAGFNVILTSADINAWTGGGSFVMDWTATGATSGTLGSGDNVAIAADGVTGINFGGLTGTGAEAVTLTLTMDATSTGTGSYLAMDNLAFDQVAAVPEPSSTALAAIGLGAMAMRRRRK